MPKAICSKCKGPREPDSSSSSYCKECTRTYHRERYRQRMKDAGKVVTPRRADAPNTAEGFNDRIDEEQRTSIALRKYVNQLTSAPVPAALQLLAGEKCDACNEPNITKENINIVWRNWVRPVTFVPLSEAEDERAIELAVMIVCNDCKDIFDYIKEHPMLPALLELYKQKVRAVLPDDAPVPDAVIARRPPSDTTSTPPYQWTPVGPPPTTNTFPSPIEYKVIPNWHKLTDEELIAIGPEAFEGRLNEASAQWYEDWVYFMSKRGIIIEDGLFDEDFATFLAKPPSED